MAIVTFCGFESADARSDMTAGTQGGSTSIQATITRSGGRAFRINPTGTAIGSARIYTVASSTVVPGTYNEPICYYSFYIRPAVLPVTNSEVIAQVLTTTVEIKAELRITSSGTIELYGNLASTLLGTTAVALSADGSWYRIDLQVGTGALADYILKINGSTQLAGQAALSTTNNGFIRIGKAINRNGETLDIYYDDVVVDNADFIGEYEIKLLRATANGSTMQWTSGTGADFTQVDEIPFSTVDYVASGSPGDVALFRFETTAAVGITGTVHAIVALVYGREHTSGTGELAVRVRANGSNSDSPFIDLTTSDTLRARLLSTNPGTGVAWTLANLDAVEAGAVDGPTGAVRQRIDWIGISVLYTPGSGGSSVPIISHIRRLMES